MRESGGRNKPARASGRNQPGFARAEKAAQPGKPGQEDMRGMNHRPGRGAVCSGKYWPRASDRGLEPVFHSPNFCKPAYLHGISARRTPSHDGAQL